MAKQVFWDVFNVHPDGSIEPRIRIQVGGVQFGPGVRFGRGIAFGGVDIATYVGHDLETKTENGITVITGIY